MLISAIVIQIYPLIYQFWKNVFVLGFNNYNIMYDSKALMGGIRASIAVLVVFMSIFGQVSLYYTFLLTLYALILYCLNVAVNIQLATSSDRTNGGVVDIGGGMDIFLFSGCLAFFIAKKLRK